MCLTAVLRGQPAVQQQRALLGIFWPSLTAAGSQHASGKQPYLRQCKHAKSSFKFQFWWASQCICLSSTIFTLLSQPSVRQSVHHLALPACLCISGTGLGPLKGHGLRVAGATPHLCRSSGGQVYCTHVCLPVLIHS